ncbi:MAG: hypothetical protein HZA08_02485 [Nitrospirae bacterium]|nr:hypothetical protein [Nitrospirota bacterium]
MKKSNIFEWVLIITVIITICVGSYESYTQKYIPDQSMLSYLHSHGYLKDYPVIYEPSKGIWHPVGWTGSLMMVVMMLYSVRKRIPFLRSFGSMRHWLSSHIFLGILGPILVTFHTTFKFGGLIATSFWCMVVTVIFGILGRYIYVQIPRDISGVEIGVKEIETKIDAFDKELGKHLGQKALSDTLKSITTADDKGKDISPLIALLYMVKTDVKNIFMIFRVSGLIRKQHHLDRKTRKEVIYCIKKKGLLIRRKNLLTTSHRLLHYWHVLHVPLAMVMFAIMFLHILVYYMFRVGA